MKKVRLRRTLKNRIPVADYVGEKEIMERHLTFTYCSFDLKYTSFEIQMLWSSNRIRVKSGIRSGNNFLDLILILDTRIRF